MHMLLFRIQEQEQEHETDETLAIQVLQLRCVIASWNWETRIRVMDACLNRVEHALKRWRKVWYI